jgi:hypothetical protein
LALSISIAGRRVHGRAPHGRTATIDHDDAETMPWFLARCVASALRDPLFPR